jgi:hypothetical protein
MAEQQSEPVSGGISSRTDGSVGTGAVTRRPGILTFAAVMMFVVAGFTGLLAMTEFAGTGWWVTASGDLVYANLIVWGIVDLVIAIIALYAGIDILRGATYGLVVGYLFAGIGLVRWLFYIPITPVLSVVMVALCALVIYGLAKHSDYFGGA